MILQILLAAVLAGGGLQVTDLQRADKLFAEKSYASAADAYERALMGAIDPDRRPEIELRFAESLGRAKKWDRAIAEGMAFVKRHRGSIWEPRGLHWLGRLYFGVPNIGWKAGDKFFRGADAPTGSFAEKPQYRTVLESDLRNGIDALEAARILYPKYQAAAEEIQLDFDLARGLRNGAILSKWAAPKDWAAPTDPRWKIDLALPYSRDWAPPKKILYLYRSAEALTPGEYHQAALARFAEAVWLRQYAALMRVYAVRWKDEKPQRIPYPYQDLSARATLESILTDPRFADESVRDLARYTIGAYAVSDGKLDEAAGILDRLLRDQPQTAMKKDANLLLARIRGSVISVGPAEAVQYPGSSAKIKLAYRNVSRAHLRLFQIPLEQHLGVHPLNADNAYEDLLSFPILFGKNLQFMPKTPVAEWDVETGHGLKAEATKSTKPIRADSTDHLPHEEILAIPAHAEGCYVVEASVGKLKSMNLVFITRLALVVKPGRDSALCFTADARTGKPIPGVTIDLLHTSVMGNRVDMKRSTGVSGRDGLVTVPYALHGVQELETYALAQTGSSYATTGRGWTHDFNARKGIFRAYAFTDRAVYRPGQKVKFRVIALRGTGAQSLPASGEPVHVEFSSMADYEKKIHRWGKCSPFGTYAGEIDLSEDAKLGEYYGNVRLGPIVKQSDSDGSIRFRVEEYKKPEFQVTVKPSKDRVYLGEYATATVEARYYFGGPVPNSRVTYRIYRSSHDSWFRFPESYDYLYEARRGGRGNSDPSGSPVDQGEAHTDLHGKAVITFKTQPDPRSPEYWENVDYEVRAEVQDSSRRVIAGMGTVTAVKSGLSIHMRLQTGYVRPGETARLDLATVDPVGRPVAASGTVKVVRDPDTRQAREVRRWKLQTGASGRTQIVWKPDSGGYYAVTFMSRDSRGHDVKESTAVWALGPELVAGKFKLRYGSTALVAYQTICTPGATTRALLVTPAPDCTALVTRHADNQILDKRIIQVSGRATEIELPITERDAPNVGVSVIIIRDKEAHEDSISLSVPPVSRLAQVSVTAGQSRFKPGESAILHLHARDHFGRPLRTELSLGVSDASLDYIDEGSAGDVRQELYGSRDWWDGSSQTSFVIQLTEHNIGNNSDRGTAYWTPPPGMGRIPDWPGVASEDWGLMPDLPSPTNGQFPKPHEDWLYYQGTVFGDRGISVNGISASQPNNVLPGAIGGKYIDHDGGYVAGKVYEPMGVVRVTGRATMGYSLTDTLDLGRAMDQVRVRRQFLDTALWIPAVVTDAQGNATVKVTWPDNLTRWRARAVGIGMGGEVGNGEVNVETKKDVLVRLSVPRFAVERDRLTVSATVHNDRAKPSRTRVRLDLGGECAQLLEGSGGHRAEAVVEVPAHGEKRLDWDIRTTKAGALPIEVRAAAADGDSDAMALEIPVLVHGAERVLTQSGVLRNGGTAEITVGTAGTGETVLKLQPSLAVVALDALPYLIDYPYGCVEQTMSRFMPAVAVQKTLRDLGFDLDAIKKRAQQQRTNTGPTVIKKIANTPYTAPRAAPDQKVTKPRPSYLPPLNPVFDREVLDAVVRASLQRIRSMQHPDGGWGWWKSDNSDGFMTAYVVYGLLTARTAGVAIDGQMLKAGQGYLKSALEGEKSLDRKVYVARVLAMDRATAATAELAMGTLYDRRERMSIYSGALMALALKDLGQETRAKIVLSNIEDAAVIDEAGGMASWPAGDNWWEWQEDRVETQAAALMAYLAIRPESRMVPMIVKWLVKEREGLRWPTTRETALSVLALSAYLKRSDELSPAFGVVAGGKRFQVNRENALLFDERITVPTTGTTTIEMLGRGSLYYSAYTRCFSREEPIPAVAGDLAVTRRHYRLIPVVAPSRIVAANRPNPLLTGQYDLVSEESDGSDGSDVSAPDYRRELLAEGASLQSGDLIEVEMEIASRNDYSYLVFEDIKPAGCEPVDLQSGDHWEPGLYSNKELRDQKVAFFISDLPQGRRRVTYRLYAETPGRFHVLPTNAYAMYAPAVRALSDEAGFRIVSRPEH